MSHEIELKLEIDAERAEELLASDLLPGTPRIIDQRSIYFDTPGKDLATAGFSLRIRNAAGRITQTVKAAGSTTAGLFARPEWERDIEGDAPILDDTTPLKALLGKKLHDLASVFEIAVERQVWDINWEGSQFELMFDRGEVIAGDLRAPVCEIELELKQGSPAALFSYARRIDALAAVRLGVVNKAERGWRLLRNASGSVKAEQHNLAADATAADAFLEIAGKCLRQFRLNEPLIVQREAEAVHQARVALRRLRSALSIFRPVLDDASYDRIREESRWLAGELGEARDLDVLIDREDVDGNTLEKLKLAREEAYERAIAALASWRARTFMIDLSEWLALGEWLSRDASAEKRDQRAKEFASSALDRIRRKVKKGGRNLADLDDATRHDVRKDAKKLRYAAEFFASLFDGKRSKRRLKRFVATLEGLQDHLGQLNDLVVADEVLARVGLEEGSGGKSARSVAKLKRNLIEAAADAHDDFADAKPFWR